MKTHENKLKLSAMLFMLVVPTIIFGQGGLLGSWKYVSPAGEMTMQISASTIVINGQSFPYKAQGNVLMINEGTTTTPYPYMLDGNQLTLEFPGGMEVVFTRSAAGAPPQDQLPQSMSKPSGNMGQGQTRQTTGGGSTWQLKGALCSWSGSSNDYSSYSRTQKIVFDGQGNFQFGSESSFSSDDGIAYGGNPNVSRGTYNVGESTVTLYYQDGDIYEFKINMRQDNGMITELMYDGTLYATGLCE